LYREYVMLMRGGPEPGDLGHTPERAEAAWHRLAGESPV
jgi:hypothetical protein